MIIFVYGPDDYRRSQKKKELIAGFLKKRSSLGIDFFDLETDGALGRLKEFLRSQSIFEDAKLAVLENAFAIPPAELTLLLKPVNDEKNIKILLSEKEKPVKALAFMLEPPTLSQKFEHLAGAEWLAFIASEAKKSGVTLSPATTQFLGTVYAGNSWGLVTELQKISGLASSIDKKDLDGFDLEAAPNYWALLNGMKSVDLRNRLFALETLLALNDPPAKIFNILAAQAAEKTPRMAEYDFAVKSGKLEYDEVLVDMAIGG